MGDKIKINVLEREGVEQFEVEETSLTADLVEFVTPAGFTAVDVRGALIELKSEIGGDYTDGGEAGGANRTLGNTDAFSLGFITNNIERLSVDPNGLISIINSNSTALLSITNNTVSGEFVRLINSNGNEVIQLNSSGNADGIIKVLKNNGDKTFVADNGFVKVGSGVGEVDFVHALLVVGDTKTTGYIQVQDITAPANGAAGEGRIYKKTGDDGIFWKPDSAGAEVDLTNAGGVTVTQATATANTTSTSSTDVLINSMTLTPGAGDYKATFSSSLSLSANNDMYFSFYVNGVKVAHTERTYDGQSNAFSSAILPFSLSAYLPSVGAGEAIEVRWRRFSSGTMTARQRTLVLTKV